MIAIKAGVDTSNLVAEMLDAETIIEQCYVQVGAECWITSGRDGVHHGLPVGDDKRDPHYEGKALDFRLSNVPTLMRPGLVEAIRSRLGDQYVVLWERAGQPGEHLHVQFGHVLA